MASTTLEQQRRQSTRHRGISYREKANGSRSYAVFFQGRYIAAGSTESEALAKQADLRGSKARGEKPILPSKTTFAELAESWFERKAPRLRKRTSDYYRSALDLVLLPRFGKWKVAAVDVDAVSALIRDLETRGLNALDPSRPVRPLGHSSIENYLKPLQGILQRAVRDRLISANPFQQLTDDDRPKRGERAPSHEWADEDVRALLEASAQIAHKPESRYDYTFLLRVVATLGLRCGEVLGLRWVDFDKDAGLLHVRGQWLRSGEYGPTKTPAGTRTLELPDDLRDELIAFRLASEFSQDEHPIFASRVGTPLTHRNVTRRGFEPARDVAGLPATIVFHDLRDAVVSRLIAAGFSAVEVAGFIGHDDPGVTLRVYAKYFNRQQTGERIRIALASSQ